MRTINIHEAKTHLSRLVDEAVAGEPFIIAKAGKPKVQVLRLETQQDKPHRRLGFLKGQITVPDDFDTMMADEIEKLFSDEKKIVGSEE
ncbi:MAG: type II toxin-antitoxin system prevent-host-death family antitoxin [Terracidiphilus sp.]|jgi:prevent-host-death family protein